MNTSTTPATTTGRAHCKVCHRDRTHRLYPDGSTFCMSCGHRDARQPWRPAC